MGSDQQDKLTLESVDVDGAIRETAAQASETLAERGDTRLDFFRKAGIAGGSVVAGGALMSALVPGTALAAKGGGRPPASFGEGDIGILNYALTLEYLEAAFYIEATENNASSAFVSDQAAVFLETVTADEKAHVKYLQDALGKDAVAEPKFDFGTTTSNADEFLQTAFVLENTGVAAYSGQVLNIEDPKVVKAAASILTVEARHASVIGLIKSGSTKGIVPNGPFDKALSAKRILKAVKQTGFIQG